MLQAPNSTVKKWHLQVKLKYSCKCYQNWQNIQVQLRRYVIVRSPVVSVQSYKKDLAVQKWSIF